MQIKSNCEGSRCIYRGFSGDASGNEPTCQCRRPERCGFDPWVKKNPLEKKMATHSSVLAWTIPWPEEPSGYRPWGGGGPDTTGSRSTAHFQGPPHPPELACGRLGEGGAFCLRPVAC